MHVGIASYDQHGSSANVWNPALLCSSQLHLLQLQLTLLGTTTCDQMGPKPRTPRPNQTASKPEIPQFIGLINILASPTKLRKLSSHFKAARVFTLKKLKHVDFRKVGKMWKGNIYMKLFLTSARFVSPFCFVQSICRGLSTGASLSSCLARVS